MEALRQTRYFMGHVDYELFNDSVSLGGLEPGIYLVEFSSPQTETSLQFYYVSGVRLLSQAMPDEQKRQVAVDALTGKPLSNATIQEVKRYGKQLFAYTPTDCYCPPINAYGRYVFNNYDYHAEHTSLFTDRSIYRPGQTVHVTAVVWKEQSATDNVAVGEKSVNITLRDANYKQIAEKKVTTDRFGKCTTEFTLPTGLLNGRFTILANGSSTSISVEEYKRPTFQVEFADYQKSYQQGDTVHAQGKALTYAGVPVQGAKVKYTVRRKVAFWWMTYSRYWGQGTDMGGETHSGTLSLPLSNKPTALTCDIPEQVRKDQLPPLTFYRRNAAGKEIAGTVKYRIDGGKWNECAANVQCPKFKVQSGEHRLEAICEQDTLDVKFVVFGLDDKKPATQTNDWFYVSHTQFPNDGTPITLQVGSSAPDLYIFYAIYADNKVIEQGEVKKNGELINRQFKYKEEYGNGLLLSYAWMKEGVCYSHQQTIKRPMPDKKLRLSWETFRDRLTPGQQEEWSLKIQNPDGTPADASLMAVLYDKSLDQIKSHQWNLSPVNYLPMPSTSWRFHQQQQVYWMGSQHYQSPLKVNDMVFSRFDDSVYPYYRYIRVRGARAMMKAKASGIGAYAANDAVMESTAMTSAVAKEEAADEAKLVVEDKEEISEQVQVRERSAEGRLLPEGRKNLNETAFCYPMLVTDKDGNVVMKFTLPESLTTWRFMGVANTVDMNYGSIEGEVIAQKDVMVQPNVPRTFLVLSAWVMRPSFQPVSLILVKRTSVATLPCNSSTQKPIRWFSNSNSPLLWKLVRPAL